MYTPTPITARPPQPLQLLLPLPLGLAIAATLMEIPRDLGRLFSYWDFLGPQGIIPSRW